MIDALKQMLGVFYFGGLVILDWPKAAFLRPEKPGSPRYQAPAW